MRVWFFDVEQGDAIFIETPNGEQILVDGGPGEAVLTKLGAVMPAWDHTLDMIVNTHLHSDHVAGLIEVLDRYQVETIVETGSLYRSEYAEAWDERVSEEEAKIVIADQIEEIYHENNLSLMVVYPDSSLDGVRLSDLNEASIVLLLQYGETQVLLTGDMYLEEESVVLESVDNIDVMKAPHHGSISSSSIDFVSSTDPEAVVFTVGQDNQFGHPHPVVVSRYENIEAEIFRSDTDGDVLLTSDGEDYEVGARPLIF